MASLMVAVKGDPQTNMLLDCPFCQRVLITLETKKAPYRKEFIDFDNKPQWLLDHAAGKVPVVNEGDFWLADSDEIVKWAEAKWPEPSMATKVPPEVTGSLFGAFRGLLLSKAPEEQAEKKATFEAELQKVNDYLEQHGPFFGGDRLDATDAATAPKLYHALVALGHYKGLQLDAQRFPAVERYRQALKGVPAWTASLYPPEAIVAGWAKHMA